MKKNDFLIKIPLVPQFSVPTFWKVIGNQENKRYCHSELTFSRLIYLSKSNLGAKGDWDFRISDLVKNPDGTDT